MPKLQEKWDRGWREVAKDIAIVFVGVLIALYAQQLVDNWEWRKKVRTAEAAMRWELFYDNGPQVYQRAVMHPCLRARLGAIRTAVDAGKERQELAGLIDGIQIDFTSYDSLAIESAFASDVAAHMPQDRLNAYIQAYQLVPMMDRLSSEDMAIVGRLRSLPRTGGALTSDEKGRVLEAAEALSEHDQMMFIAARWTLPAMRRLGGELDPVRMQRFMNFARHHYGACIKDLPPNWALQSSYHPDNYRPDRPIIER